MTGTKTKRPCVAKGKDRAQFVLPDRLIAKIGHMAVAERTRPSYVAERLLMKGLEAEAYERKSSQAPIGASN